VVEPWIEGVWESIDQKIKEIERMPKERVEELRRPVMVEEEKEK